MVLWHAVAGQRDAAEEVLSLSLSLSLSLLAVKRDFKR